MKIDLEKYRYGTEENQRFLKEKMESLLHFGTKFPSQEGGAYWLGDDGTPWRQKGRMTWITSRMVHVYSLGSLLGYSGCYELAKRGFYGLTGELRDENYDGWYAGRTMSGEPITEKQCYTHAFVIIASSSALLAGIPGAKTVLEEELKVFYDKFWNEKTGLAVDTWDESFTHLDTYRGLNANMHTVEAFLAAADATGKELYREWAGRIIRHVITWAGDNNWRIPEHYNVNWTPNLEKNRNRAKDPFKPYGATPGHGIEWARLIIQWALSSCKDTERSIYVNAAEQLFRRAVSDSWNVDGSPGIVYTTDWKGTPVVRDRMHWTLAEAINTASVFIRTTNRKEYFEIYESFMKYLDEFVIDHKNGSWYHQMDYNNHPIGTVWPGKSDLYHAVQSCLIPYEPIDRSIASAVYSQSSINEVDGHKRERERE